jgi:sigma-B regulation protein RsbQ
VQVPTLVLQMREDAIAPVGVGQFVQQQLGRAELVLLDATGHCPNLSAPEQTIAAIEAFLAAPAR